MHRTRVITLLFLTIGSWRLTDLSAAEAMDPYHALYDSIMVREVKPVDGPTETVGQEDSAPLLWSNSRYLLEGESGLRFRRALETFAALTDSEMADYTPLERALLQRPLWAVFDWSARVNDTAGPGSDSLPLIRKESARLLHRLALSAEEIAALPDTLKATSRSGQFPSRADSDLPFQPFFPENLSDPTGPWVCLTRARHRLTAESHTRMEQWRSTFQIYMRLPGGREDTLGYLKTLGEFRAQWTTVKPDDSLLRRTTPNGGIHEVDVYVNPETPQFPAGTQLAMVEQVLLISDCGEIVPSPLVSSVQVREYLRVEARLDPKKPDQAVAEFHLNPRDAMKGVPTLSPLGPDERFFRTFGVANDPFENLGGNQHGMGARLRSCVQCHSGWGIHSVNSRSQLFEMRTLLPPRFEAGDPDRVIRATIEAKKNDFTWGLLQGLAPVP